MSLGNAIVLALPLTIIRNLVIIDHRDCAIALLCMKWKTSRDKSQNIFQNFQHVHCSNPFHHHQAIIAIIGDAIMNSVFNPHFMFLVVDGYSLTVYAVINISQKG